MTGSKAVDGVLVDTNIIVYVHDPRDQKKHEIAIRLLADLGREGRLVVSAQILNEFYVVAMRRARAIGLTHEQAAGVLADLATAADVLPLTSQVTLRAVEAIPKHGLSFWDALIWSAAKEYGIPAIYTEDFQHGREVEGVRFINPFLAPVNS